MSGRGKKHNSAPAGGEPARLMTKQKSAWLGAAFAFRQWLDFGQPQSHLALFSFDEPGPRAPLALQGILTNSKTRGALSR